MVKDTGGLALRCGPENASPVPCRSCGGVRSPPSLFPSPPAMVRRQDPAWIMRAGELALPSPAAALGGAGPAPPLGSTGRLTLIAEWGRGSPLSQLQGYERGRAGPATCLPCCDISKGEMASPPLPPSHLQLALTLTCCSTWESRPCTSPGQHSRASYGHGEFSGEPAPRA